MKSIKILSILLLVTATAFAQVEYHVTKVSVKKINPITKEYPKNVFNPVKTKTTIMLFNNALTVRGHMDLSLKFVRKLAYFRENGLLYAEWKAIDLSGSECLVALKDYGSYTRIGISWTNGTTAYVYETM